MFVNFYIKDGQTYFIKVRKGYFLTVWSKTDKLDIFGIRRESQILIAEKNSKFFKILKILVVKMVKIDIFQKLFFGMFCHHLMLSLTSKVGKHKAYVVASRKSMVYVLFPFSIETEEVVRSIHSWMCLTSNYHVPVQEVIQQ